MAIQDFANNIGDIKLSYCPSILDAEHDPAAELLIDVLTSDDS